MSLHHTKLIFIGGSPRSGTTMVQNILNSHQDVLGLPEFKHLPDIIFLRNQMIRNVNRKLIHDFCDPAMIDRQIKDMIQNLLINVIQDPVINKKGASILSEKTPANVLVFKELAKMYPEAKFIFVIRDPRGIVNSILNLRKKAQRRAAKPPAFSKNLTSAITYVRQHIEAGLSFVKKHPERVITVNYEELVLHPKRETQRICDFLDISWDENMLHPSRKKHLSEATMTNEHNADFYDRKTFNRDPDKSNLGKWREQLPLKSKILVSKEFSRYGELNQRYRLSTFLRQNPFYTWLGTGYQFINGLKQKMISFGKDLKKVANSYG